MARLRDRRYWLTREELALGAAFVLLVVPAARLSASPVNASYPTAILAALTTLLLAAVTRTFADGSLPLRIGGGVVIVVGLSLLNAASYPGSGFVVAALLGLGIGSVVPRDAAPVPALWASPIAALILFLFLRMLPEAAISGIAFIILILAMSHNAPSRGHFQDWQPRAALEAMVIWGAFSIFWVGSTPLA